MWIYCDHASYWSGNSDSTYRLLCRSKRKWMEILMRRVILSVLAIAALALPAHSEPSDGFRSYPSSTIGNRLEDPQ